MGRIGGARHRANMTAPDKTVRFTVSLAEELLAELDRQLTEKGYASRSEFIRDLIREKVVEDRWQDDRRQVFGVLTIGYDHHARELAQKIIDVQHSRYVNVLCSTHVHLDHDNCLESIMIRGKPSEISRIANEIGGLRGVKLAKLTKASVVER